MKFSNVLIISAALVISKVSACIPDCWAEPLGYECCKGTDPKVEASDESGDWSIENGEWCGILVYDHNLRCAPTTSEEPETQKVEPTPTVKEEKVETCQFYNCISIMSIGEDGTLYSKNDHGKCKMDLKNAGCKGRVEKYAKAVLLGYDLCKEKHEEDLLMDENGYWAMENGKWCGVQICPRCEFDTIDTYGLLWSTDGFNGNRCIVDSKDCGYTLQSSCRSARIGYKCCEKTNEVVTVDDFGFWGVEDGKWCGINQPFPCPYYEEKGFTCCDQIRVNYNNLNITSEGIYAKVDGKICGVYN